MCRDILLCLVFLEELCTRRCIFVRGSHNVACFPLRGSKISLLQD